MRLAKMKSDKIASDKMGSARMRWEIILLWVLAFVMVSTICSVAAHASTNVILYPTEDSYVDSSQPSKNFTNLNLRVGNDLNTGKTRSFLKFDLSQLNGSTPKSATLSMDALFPFGTPIDVYHVTTDSWSQATLNWNSANSLPFDPSVIDAKTVTQGGRISFNVISAMNSSGASKVSFMLKSDQESTPNLYTQFFSSRMDDNSYKPYLNVTIDGSSQCNTQADIDCNGCVSLGEMIQTIVKFKQGSSQLSLGQLIQIIVQFKTGGISC